MKMHQRIAKIKASEEVNVKYMKEWEEREEEKIEAREEGRKEGREEGRKEGREEGREEGKAELSSEIVLNMHKQNCPPEQISMFTGIKLDTVQEIIRGVESTT